MRCGLRVAMLAAAGALSGGAAMAQPAPGKSAIPTCDGYPRADIGMAPGFCAGLVIGPPSPKFASRQLRLPRSLVQRPNGDWIVSDLGGWGSTRGAIWRLRARPGQPAELTQLIGGLNLPHALAIGPDGLVYVGEMSRIFRFDPEAPDPAATLQPVIADLPHNQLHDNRHPLSKFVFAADGALIVNVGALTDQCLDAPGVGPGKACPEDGQTGVLRRYAPDGAGGWRTDYTIYAQGLRNSVALAVNPAGTLLQGENSYDIPVRWAPFDEINVIEPGDGKTPDFGWPYCDAQNRNAPGWPDVPGDPRRCGDSVKRPALLLPPHAAPLDMLWYQGAMFPGLRGRLLITWHGYRSTGGRLVAFETDARGVPRPAGPKRKARYPVYGGPARPYGLSPSADALVITPGWGTGPTRKKQGAPVGIAVADDGAIWITDDKAGQVIRIAVDRP